MMPYRHEIFGEATRRLATAGVDDPAGDVGRLIDCAFGADKWHYGPSDPGDGEGGSIEWFWSALAAREQRRPVSQIIGRRMFFGRNFLINSAVMDPRPESETLVFEALGRKPSCILDVGTGSGCLLLTILAELPDAVGLGVDLHGNVLDVARRNSASLGLADRAKFAQSDWLSQVNGEFDLVVSNPPYVSEREYMQLAPEIREWEPRDSITVGQDGLCGYRSIARGTGRHLAANAELLVEIGAGQRSVVATIFRAEGFVDSGVAFDLDARERVLAFRYEKGQI